MVFCVFTLTDIVWGNIYWSIYVDWTAFLRWSDMEEIFSKSELLYVSATKILSDKNVLAYWDMQICVAKYSTSTTPTNYALFHPQQKRSICVFVVVDLCENGSAVSTVMERPYTTSPSLPVSCSHQG